MEDEGRLASAIGAEQRHSLALVDREVDPEEGAVAVGISEADPTDLQRGGAHTSTQATLAMTAPTAGSASATSHWSTGAVWSSTIGSVPS